jgi:hypothetical protein
MMESRTMHVEKLRPAIGFEREMTSGGGDSDAGGRHFQHVTTRAYGHSQSVDCEQPARSGTALQ